MVRQAHQPGRGQRAEGKEQGCKEEGYYGYFGGHDIKPALTPEDAIKILDQLRRYDEAGGAGRNLS